MFNLNVAVRVQGAGYCAGTRRRLDCGYARRDKGEMGLAIWVIHRNVFVL
jgi:hypothetical protein